MHIWHILTSIQLLIDWFRFRSLCFLWLYGNTLNGHSLKSIAVEICRLLGHFKMNGKWLHTMPYFSRSFFYFTGMLLNPRIGFQHVTEILLLCLAALPHHTITTFGHIIFLVASKAKRAQIEIENKRIPHSKCLLKRLKTITCNEK